MLKEKVEETYANKDNSNHAYAPRVYYPSEVPQCLRKSWLRRNEPRATPPQLAKYGELGDVFHAYMASKFREAGFKTTSEIAVRIPLTVHTSRGDEPIVLSARMDDIIRVENGERYIVEVKSVSGFYNFLTYPSPDHVAQLTCYLKAYPETRGIVYYISRKDGEMREYPVEYDEQTFQNAVNRVTQLHEYLRKKELPPPEAKLKQDMRYQCKGCPYYDKCYPEAAATAANPLLPTLQPATQPATQPTTQPTPQPTQGGGQDA